MHLVAVTNKLTRQGIRAPGTRGQTWDWRTRAGSPANTGRVRPVYRVLSVMDAMTTAFDFDAHLVPYTLVTPDGDALPWQPRVGKDALPWLHALGYGVHASCLFVDVDNPNRRPWTEEDRQRARAEHALVPMLATVGICSTRYGRRLVQPLDRTLDVETFERTARAFALALDLAGVLGVDHRCCDWTRHFRVADGLRNGDREPPWWLDLSRMVPIPPPTPVATVPRQRKAGKGTVQYTAVLEPTWSVAVPNRYFPLVAELADRVIGFQGDGRKALRAVAGALCERGVPVEHVPRIVAGVGTETRHADRAAEGFDDALRTVRRWQENRAFQGLRALHALDPGLAGVLAKHTPSPSEQRLFAQVEAARAEAPFPTPVEIAARGVERTIAGATGLRVVEVGCGLGRSEAATRVALARSRKESRAADDGRGDAPPGSRTTMSCPTPAAALELATALRREGARVMRVFDPLSVLRENGTPTCRFHEAGKALEAVGPVLWQEFCGGRQGPRCAHWEGCTARGGTDADEGARVVVVDHGAISTYRAAIAKDELLVVDEPPEPIDLATFTEADFEACLQRKGDFLPRAWTLALPLVLAARAALAPDAVTRTDVAHSAEALLGIGWRAVPESAVREALDAAGDLEPLAGTDTMARVFAVQCGALAEDVGGASATVHPEAVRGARDAPDVAVRLGRAAALVRALSQAAVQEPPASLRLRDFNGRRSLTLALIAPAYLAVLRRGGPTVLLDTNLTRPHALAELVLKTPVPRHRFASPDAEPARREVWLEPRARRTHWLKKGAGRWPDWEKGLLRAIQCLVQHAIERSARRIGVITLPSVASAWRVALGQAPPPEMPAEEVDLARRVLAPMLAGAADVRWEIGHYGELSSLHGMAFCGGLVTLMDPFPDLGTARHAAACYRPTMTREQYLDAVTSATLERAHGLASQPHRFGPCWAVHIGATLPGGYGWDRPDVVVRRTRVRPVRGAMTVDELRAIKGPRKIGALARAVGIKENTLTRYLNGSRGVSASVAERLRTYGSAHAEGAPEGADDASSRKI